MKKIIISSSLKIMSSVLLLAFTTTPATAWVKGISLERVFVGDNIRIRQVDVKCRIERKPRALRQVESTNGPWCSIDVPELCADKKFVAARKLCSYGASEFRQMAASEQTSFNDGSLINKAEEPSAKSNRDDIAGELLQEKMLIEERRIQIEQRRIELSRKEISLRKKLASMIEELDLDAS